MISAPQALPDSFSSWAMVMETWFPRRGLIARMKRDLPAWRAAKSDRLYPVGWQSAAHTSNNEAIEQRGSRPPRLSIVMLPLANFSNDPEQQYFVDCFADDLTMTCRGITDMLVISRNTACTYRNKSIDTKQIGRRVGLYAMS